MHVWTIEEIKAFGEENGFWFYGFARVDGHLRFGEIYPGWGIEVCWPWPWWSLRSWRMAWHDVRHVRP